jgi:hypothetical protein
MKLLLLFLVILLTACDGKLELRTDDRDTIYASDVVQAFKQFQQAQFNQIEACLMSLDQLQSSVTDFLSSPNSTNQELSQQAWLQAHKAFLGSNLFSLVSQNQLIFQIDAWPIQEGFLDSIPNYPQSGIINDLTVAIDTDSLQEQHGITDYREVSLGFHALEFFIFSRDPEDFSLSGDNIKLRRRAAMKVILDLLISDILLAFEEIGEASADFLSELEDYDGKDLEGLTRLLGILNTRMQLLYSEANHIDDDNSGHSRISQSSWANLRDQIAVMNNLSGQKSELRKIFEKLDQKTTHDYDLTLNEAREILSEKKPGTDKSARIPLLFAALGHQLGDLQTILENRANE